VLRGLWLVYHQRGELERSRELGEQCLRLAQSQQEPALLLEAHRALGITAFYFGEFAPARAHFEQGIAIYDPQLHHSHAFLYGLDPGVVFHMFAAWALWMLGYPDQAMQRIHDALTLAGELSHPLSLAQTLNFAAWLHHLRRDGPAAQELAEAAITLSTEQRFPLWLTWGTVLRGWALAAQGQVEEGIGQMRQGLAAHRATGAALFRPSFLALLAEAYGNGGKVEEGLSVLVDALADVKRNREHWWEAELYRLKGELLLALSEEDPVAAEACFRQAIDIARRQGARSLELRAVMSLNRLCQRQGRNEAARQTLLEIYSWFTEGFHTADLEKAKSLIDELR
jgi:predicted ATPase